MIANPCDHSAIIAIIPSQKGVFMRILGGARGEGSKCAEKKGAGSDGAQSRIIHSKKPKLELSQGMEPEALRPCTHYGHACARASIG